MKLKRTLLFLLIVFVIFSIPVSSFPVVSQRELCEVHRVPLRKGKVPIKWGLVIYHYPEGFKEAERILFPNSNKVIFGGCLVPDNPPSEGEVLYCQKCRDAEYEWVLNWIQENR